MQFARTLFMSLALIVCGSALGVCQDPASPPPDNTKVNALLRERPRKYLVEDSWVAEGS